MISEALFGVGDIVLTLNQLICYDSIHIGILSAFVSSPGH